MLKGKLPSEVVNERQQYVNSLKHFVEEQEKKLKQVLHHLGLTEELLAKVEPKQLCPYNPHHYVPEKSFKSHVEKCRLRKAGYQKDELPSQLAKTDFCYEGKNSMKIEIDESLMNKIIWDDCVQRGEVYTGHRTLPASHMEENTTLTPNDRLAIYRYVVGKSHDAGKVIEVDKSDELLTTDWGNLVKKGLLDAQDSEKYSSKLEQLAALRDMKRRRQTYRAKNVHITKKSYTEIIREVIVNQMEVLVPATSKAAVVDSETVDKYKSRVDNRQKRDGDRDGDDRGSSYSGRHRSRSGNRDRKRQKYHNDERDQDRRKEESTRDRGDRQIKGRHQKMPNSQPDVENSEALDLKLVKNEFTPVGNSDANDRTSLLEKERPSESMEKNEGNSRSSSLNQRSKRSRSRSCSSSPSSDGDHHHRHHKKSKHKKKSKHSKKHSKKHKK